MTDDYRIDKMNRAGKVDEADRADVADVADVVDSTRSTRSTSSADSADSADDAAASRWLARLDASARHHDLESAGCRVRWREWGQGRPVLLVHGGHGSWMHWARNIDALSRQFRLLVPDLPGFGDSADFDLPPRDEARLPKVLDALADGLDRLAPGEPVRVAGFSFGGAIAGLLAARLARAGRLASLALVGTAGHGRARRQTVPLVDWRLDDPQQRRAALRQNLRSFMLGQDEAVDALGEAIHRWSSEATRFRSKPFSLGIRLLDHWHDFSVPVLMVFGENDVTGTPTDVAEWLAQGREEREWIVLPRAGHWVQFEAADEVNGILARWLASHG